jgi:hypothetical protein
MAMASCVGRASLRTPPRGTDVMIYWTGFPEFDEPDGSGALREQSIAARRARLLRWALLLWVSQILVMTLFFAFD